MKKMNIKITPVKTLKGEITIPGDKSISHRAVMFGSLAKGDTHISGFLNGDDCISTIKCFNKLGIEIETEGDKVVVHGKGLHGLRSSATPLDVGNSGTTIRLISGILCGQPFDTVLTGDASIQKRPMSRIIMPLSQMGATIESTNDGFAPLSIRGSKIHAIDYTMPIASAQVKSSVLLASLFADGETIVREPVASRNHTEIILNSFGANIKSENGVITSSPVEQLNAVDINVPGDISSAAYFIVAALIVPGAEVTVKNVGVNPTRTGILDALKAMGADITIENLSQNGGEPCADITARYSDLKATVIKGDIIPRMIDEIPVFAVAALHAEGTTLVQDATELKVKESNRIVTMIQELGKMGAEITETNDGMVIRGSQQLKGAPVYSHLDHRVAMSCAVAALAAQGETEIIDGDCVGISFPDFYEKLASVRG